MIPYKIAQNGSFGCQRPVGAGYYDAEANKTFVVWNGPEMDIYVRAYCHSACCWERKIRVVSNSMTGRWDYHNYPAMIQSPDGRPRIYYAKHAHELYQLSAPHPHSLEGEWTRSTISQNRNCYPAPVTAGDDMLLFYSCNDDNRYPYRTYRFIRSGDNGTSWSEPVTIIDSGRSDPEKFDEVYMFGTEYEPANSEHQGRIHLAWSMWGGPQGHASQGKGCFYASLNLSEGHLYSADGADLGGCLQYDDMMTRGLIETAVPGEGWSHTVMCPVAVYDPIAKMPVVAYGYRDQAAPEGKVRAAVWSEGAWSVQTIDDTTFEFRDLEYDAASGTLRLIYLSGTRLVVCRRGEKEWIREETVEIPFENGAEYAPYVNFIHDHRPEVHAILGQINWEEAFTDYTGKWSILAVGAAACCGNSPDDDSSGKGEQEHEGQ
ncbi:BNR-4 repeat-containing protein [Paenibacillus sp. YN15]|uniref:BNR-4 repeat-containing protein n=1 Tax=Paenibacillus sp. YN15 TaxID=1742774 RepID=UPI000DCE768D|nr:BNR-4 repeat-containing protein [Paenibacillus sp. YN15]RAV03026.1 hypothetical protein DQG13_08105 [Paenibacillus sp. YN15]